MPVPSSPALPKMMIAFVVRRCAVELGHRPTPAEFARWANSRGAGRRRYCVFGRPIGEDEARIILEHQARLVTAKSAAPDERYVDGEPAPRAPNVVTLAGVRKQPAARKLSRGRGRG